MDKPNDIFRVKGVKIGQAHDLEAATGCTALLFENGATVGVDVRGAAPGSRELALLAPGNLIEEVHAIVLSGGSAFGLAAMNGVATFLEEQGIGYDTGEVKVPIVCGTVLYDLAIGSSSVRPDHAMGYQAAAKANRDTFLEGNFGAGTGATIGKAGGMDKATKSGIGAATLTFDGGLIVSAIVAVNALGDVFENGNIIAGMRTADDSGWTNSEQYILNGYQTEIFAGSNTTLGVILTNAKLTKAQAQRLAQTTHNAYARCIRPVHTLYDGDAIFAAATGEVEMTDQLFLSVAANRAMEKAIIRAVKAAEDLGGIKSVNY